MFLSYSVKATPLIATFMSLHLIGYAFHPPPNYLDHLSTGSHRFIEVIVIGLRDRLKVVRRLVHWEFLDDGAVLALVFCLSGDKLPDFG